MHASLNIKRNGVRYVVSSRKDYREGLRIRGCTDLDMYAV